MSNPNLTAAGTSNDDEVYRVETHPFDSEAPITVAPRWHCHRIHCTDQTSVRAINNSGPHTPATAAARRHRSSFHTLPECRGWNQTAVTAERLVCLGPNSPETQPALDVLCRGWISRDGAIRLVGVRGRAVGRPAPGRGTR